MKPLRKAPCGDRFDASAPLVDNELYLRGYKYLYAVTKP